MPVHLPPRALVLPLTAALLAAAVPGSLAAGPRVAPASLAAGPRVVASAPSPATPAVADGAVTSIARVRDRVVLGGTFTYATDPEGGTNVLRPGLLAFDAASGEVDRAFAPALSGQVTTVLAGPDDTVWVGGTFAAAPGGGPAPRLLQLDLRTGQPVPGFTAPTMDGQVRDVVLSEGRLLVGGTFRTVGGRPHGGLVALDARTGALDDALGIDVDGHHNAQAGVPGASAPVGVNALAVDPSGRHLVAVGNFRTADGADHDQVLMADLSGPTAVLADWHTDRYDDPCLRLSYDSWVRDVAFSPDGAWFVVVGTGGPHGQSLCDSAARWETRARGTVLQPTWVARTGGDSLLSVAVARAAVYVGGHQRWLNNTLGSDTAGAGAVPRPGLAALDPANGVPLSWNPGRHPRGVGTSALLLTPQGLYAGGDTDRLGVGPARVERPKVALFPLAGGAARTPDRAGRLPGEVFQAGQDPRTVVRRTFDGRTAGPPRTRPSDVDWSLVRGAFMVDGRLFTVRADDGRLHRRTFDGSRWGPDVALEPYHDPVWQGVGNGSGSTYDGASPSFGGGGLAGVSWMTYSQGRVYYVRSGSPSLWSRAFTPDSGVLGDEEVAVAGTKDWTRVTGGFLDEAGRRLYFSQGGALWSRRWVPGTPAAPVGRPTGAPVRVALSGWEGRAMFLLVP